MPSPIVTKNLLNVCPEADIAFALAVGPATPAVLPAHRPVPNLTGCWSGSARGTFFYFLVGGPRSASDPWGQVVTQEAASLGKSADVPQFLAQMDVA
jgi:hypothetical protein